MRGRYETNWNYIFDCESVLLKAFFLQNIWTIYHAVKWPHGYHRDYWSLVRPIPTLWVMVFFSKSYRLWIIPGLFILIFLLVPMSRYFLPALPFICLLAVDGLKTIKDRDIRLIWVFCIIATLIVPISADLFRPWKQYFGFRTYGLMDARYIADQLDAMELEPPIWTNDCDLYYQMNWEVPVNDFYDIAEVPGSVIDWSKSPFSQVKTRVELLPTATAMGQEPEKIPGWETEVFPLKRGQFTKLRIRRRL